MKYFFCKPSFTEQQIKSFYKNTTKNAVADSNKTIYYTKACNIILKTYFRGLYRAFLITAQDDLHLIGTD